MQTPASACPYCAVELPPRRVQCGSAECKRRYQNERVRNYLREHSPTWQDFNCAACGARVCKSSRPRASKFCSESCKNNRLRHRPGVRRRQAARRLARAADGVRSTGVWVAGDCTECGTQFATKRATLWCSPVCRKKAKRRTRRARKAGVGYKALTFRTIAERDSFTCQICGDAVDMAAVVPHVHAPTLDHVVPLARGGAHTEDNVQLAHFLCNSTKRDLMPVAA